MLRAFRILFSVSTISRVTAPPARRSDTGSPQKLTPGGLLGLLPPSDSIDRGAGRAHDRAPLFVLGPHERGQFLRRERVRLDPRRPKAGLQCRVLERLGGLAVDALHDLLRRAGGERKV